jgi:hypothetical protein
MNSDVFEVYTELKGAIDVLDNELDSRLDSGAATRRSFIADKISAVETQVKEVSDDFVTQLSDLDIEVQAGLYLGFVRALNEKFGPTINEWVDKQVVNMPKPTPLITEEEVPAKTKQRSEAYQNIKQLVELAQKFNMPRNEEMVLPKKRTGKSGKRGPRKINFLDWSVGDKSFEDLKAVVAAYPQFDKVSALTKAMRTNKKDAEGNEIPDSGINTTEPGETVEFVLPDGDTLVGIWNQERYDAAIAAPETVPAPDADDEDDEDETTVEDDSDAV